MSVLFRVLERLRGCSRHEHNLVYAHGNKRNDNFVEIVSTDVGVRESTGVRVVVSVDIGVPASDSTGMMMCVSTDSKR